MQPSPLRIDAYFLKELNFSITGKLDSDAFSDQEFEGLELKIVDKTVQLESEESRWRSEVVVEAGKKKGEKVPYSFRVMMVGFFTLDADYPKDRAKVLVETNAP